MRAFFKPSVGRCDNRSARGSPRHIRAVIAAIASALLLTACGGGGGDVRLGGDFRVDVVIGGVFVSETPVAPGGSLDVALRAGQSLKLDAGEPVVWTLFVGNTAFNANGLTIRYAGAELTATTLNSGTVVLESYAPYPLAYPVRITLVATSTYDAAQVVTARILITN